MDGDKKKLPKDLDWNDVNFYKHQHEVEAMEDRDEWVKVTIFQRLLFANQIAKLIFVMDVGDNFEMSPI